VLVEMTTEGQRRTGEIYLPLQMAGAGMLARYDDAALILLRDALDTSREITDQHRVRLLDAGRPPVRASG
jgi:hypothetical protein